MNGISALIRGDMREREPPPPIQGGSKKRLAVSQDKDPHEEPGALGLGFGLPVSTPGGERNFCYLSTQSLVSD